MFRNQIVNVLANRVVKLLGILAVLIQKLLQHRIVDKLRNTKFFGIAVHKIGDVHHHIGENFNILLLCLNQHRRNSGILNGIRHLSRHLVPCLCQNLSRQGIHHILRKDMMPDPIPKHQLFIEFISAYLRQIISSGVEEHCHNKAFRTLDAQRLAGADLFIQLQKSFLIILGSILCKARLNLRLIAEKLSDFIIGTNAHRTDQHRDRHLSGPVNAHVKDIVRIRLVL